MHLFVNYDFNVTCRTVLKEQLDKLNILYSINSMGAVYFPHRIQDTQYRTLAESLKKYGINIILNQKTVTAQRVKEVIIDMLRLDRTLPLVKISSYLSEKLKDSYRNLSQVFSEVCHMSIENFIIFHKIELAKQLLVSHNISLTEISYRLHYSSVAHLSNQFKKVTGLTPSKFQVLSKNRRAMLN